MTEEKFLNIVSAISVFCLSLSIGLAIASIHAFCVDGRYSAAGFMTVLLVFDFLCLDFLLKYRKSKQ